MKNLPVVIRTFDLGRDKTTMTSPFNQERHSFLGVRFTQFLMNEHSLFKTQLRAILRASVKGNVSILIPMVATLSELREAKAMIEEAREQLKLFHPIRFGCMVEVPSAALIIDHFAQECDFFSIGTNDLIQYALAIDRGNQMLSDYHEATDPSLIRLIHMIVSEANKARIPVSICGEIASDPRFTALLLGLGIQELSVAPRYLPLIKNVIRRTSIVEAVRLSEKVLSLTTSQEILAVLSQNYHKSVPEDLFYNPIPRE
jgi:phosphotransferase system enzyme I (PtsI)